MVIKKYAKRTLVAAAILAANVSAYAQVQLGNGEKTTWEDYAAAVNDPSIIIGKADSTEFKAAQVAYNNAVADAAKADSVATAAKTAYDDATKDLGVYQAQLTQALADDSKDTAPWLSGAYKNAQVLSEAYDGFIFDEISTSAEIYYKYSNRQLTLSFADTKPEGFESMGLEDFNAYFTTNTISRLYVDFGKDNNGNNNYTTSTNGCLTVTYSKNPDDILNDVVTAIQTLVNSGKYDERKNQATIDDLNAKINALTDSSKPTSTAALLKASQEADAALKTANTNVTTAQSALTAAQAALEKAQATADATALKAYQNVTITEDFTATTAINNNMAGYTIDGKDHIITLSGINELVSTPFAGTLHDLAVNGRIAPSLASGGTIVNAAFWVNSSKTGASYDDQGTRTAATTIGKLGFDARNDFGVDFTNGSIVSLDENETSKVYQVTVYKPTNTTNAAQYVQVKDGKFIGTNGSSVDFPENTFAKSATTDLSLANVYYTEEGNNICENAVITDRKQFYCPEDITATNLTYTRTFNEGSNAIILPFEYENDAINFVGKYDVETTEKFWFKTVGENVVPANTPVLVNATSSFTINGLENVELVATPKELLVYNEGNDGSQSCGVFKNVTAGELAGTQANNVYAFGKGEFNPVKQDAAIPSFRMVILSTLAKQNAAMATPRAIGFYNEFGVDITNAVLNNDNISSAIEEVEANVAELTIEGGVGEIIFNAEVEYGKVAVYSLDGKVAAVANVVAGTTTVNVNNGLYIVNGQKVLVK